MLAFKWRQFAGDVILWAGALVLPLRHQLPRREI